MKASTQVKYPLSVPNTYGKGLNLSMLKQESPSDFKHKIMSKDKVIKLEAHFKKHSKVTNKEIKEFISSSFKINLAERTIFRYKKHILSYQRKIAAQEVSSIDYLDLNKLPLSERKAVEKTVKIVSAQFAKDKFNDLDLFFNKEINWGSPLSLNF